MEGSVPRGGVIEIVHEDVVVAKAVSQFAAKELERVIGKRSGEAKAILGRKGAVNVTRKNNVVVLDRRTTGTGDDPPGEEVQQ